MANLTGLARLIASEKIRLLERNAAHLRQSVAMYTTEHIGAAESHSTANHLDIQASDIRSSINSARYNTKSPYDVSNT